MIQLHNKAEEQSSLPEAIRIESRSTCNMWLICQIPTVDRPDSSLTLRESCSDVLPGLSPAGRQTLDRLRMVEDPILANDTIRLPLPSQHQRLVLLCS